VALPSAVTPDAGDTVTFEAPALGGPAVKVTVGCVASAMPPTLAVIVLVSALVEAMVPVVTPCASVADGGCVIVLPAPVAARVTALLGTGLPLASRTVTVTVATATPSATSLDASIATLDCAALTAPAT